jgi:hypothetical protein
MGDPTERLLHGVRFYSIRRESATKFVEVHDLLQPENGTKTNRPE